MVICVQRERKSLHRTRKKLYLCRRNKKALTTDNRDRYSDFDALVGRHRRMIRAICLWHATGGAVECDDLVQEVLTSLWRYRHTLREGASPGEEKAWVRWHCRSVISHMRRRKQVETTRLDDDQLPATNVEDDHRATIAELATDLTAHEQQVLQMILDGYQTEEIAERLGIKTRSVAQTRWRIVQKMKLKNEKHE